MAKRRRHTLAPAQLDVALRVLVIVLVLVATALLSLGEHSARLSILTVFMAGGSIWLTDVTGRLRLNQFFSNLAALAVMIGSVIHACYVDRHGLMLVVADLQSYLQYVLFFQKKTSKTYWQLALLSLGQMAISSTLVPGPTFGIVLLVYLFVGTITFALLLLQVEGTKFDPRSARVLGAARPAQPSAVGAAPTGALALTGGSAAIHPVAVGRGLFEQATFIAATTLLVASTIFFLLPRWTIRNRQAPSNEPLRSIGFAKTVTLGELGQVVRNPEIVMRIQFFHRRSSKPFKLIGEPLFRGTVVSHYEQRRWSQASTLSFMRLSDEVKTPYVRQKITAEPLDVPELFCIFPVFTLQPDVRLQIDTRGDQLARREEDRGTTIDFEVATPGIRNERQLRYLPCESPLRPSQERACLQMPEGDDGQDLFPGLREVAASALRERSISPSERAAAATTMNNYLRRSGTFFYTLEPQVRDADLDPLEDFVTKHRRGHCEYFAGALAMMLRSQGIPARMAIGFKGGEWNALGMYYQVQQLHAHAWVEVYLGPGDIPEDAFGGEDEKPAAAWMVLDPTEGTQEAIAAAENHGLVARLRQSMDYGYVLWSNYVVGLNSKRQRQGIYEPLVQAASAAVENLLSAEVWQARWNRIADSRVGMFWQWYRRHWFSWRGGLVAIGFSLSIVGLYWALRRGVEMLRRYGLVRSDGDDKQVLEIFRRLEAALRKRGLARMPGQTPYEFALVAGGELAESIEHRRLAPLPRRVVEAFYRVRFGHRTLDNQEADAVEHALVELELALAQAR